MTTRYSDLSEGAQKNKGFEGNKALLKLDVSEIVLWKIYNVCLLYGK